jgi:hypothetical protein
MSLDAQVSASISNPPCEYVRLLEERNGGRLMVWKAICEVYFHGLCLSNVMKFSTVSQKLPYCHFKNVIAQTIKIAPLRTLFSPDYKHFFLLLFNFYYLWHRSCKVHFVQRLRVVKAKQWKSNYFSQRFPPDFPRSFNTTDLFPVF